jgi:cob(I)alamin adenosyltransferase
LTEKRLDQFTQVMRNMAAELLKNPEVAKNSKGVSANASIDEMVAAIDKIPPMKRSIESAGMTTREYMLFQIALFSAAMGNYAVQQGQKLPAEFSAEHVAFYKAHEDKFKTLQKEWEELNKKMKATEDQEEEEEEESEE